MLHHVTGDVVWRIVQGEFKRGIKAATINRRLSVVRNLLRMARDEWQWIHTIPKVRMLGGEVERDRWLTRAEADRLIQRGAARLTWRLWCDTPWRQGVERQRLPAWNGNGWTSAATRRGSTRPRTARPGSSVERRCSASVERAAGQASPLLLHAPRRADPLAVVQHRLASALKRAGIKDFRFHDLRHTFATWHRQAGNAYDELKGSGGWKSRLDGRAVRHVAD